jgi:hypothetical protein
MMANNSQVCVKISTLEIGFIEVGGSTLCVHRSSSPSRGSGILCSPWIIIGHPKVAAASLLKFSHLLTEDNTQLDLPIQNETRMPESLSHLTSIHCLLALISLIQMQS